MAWVAQINKKKKRNKPMSGVIGFFMGFMSGGVFGLVMMAILIAGRDKYYYWEKPE